MSHSTDIDNISTIFIGMTKSTNDFTSGTYIRNTLDKRRNPAQNSHHMRHLHNPIHGHIQIDTTQECCYTNMRSFLDLSSTIKTSRLRAMDDSFGRSQPVAKTTYRPQFPISIIWLLSFLTRMGQNNWIRFQFMRIIITFWWQIGESLYFYTILNHIYDSFLGVVKWGK
jgi:hypothetical protein